MNFFSTQPINEDDAKFFTRQVRWESRPELLLDAARHPPVVGRLASIIEPAMDLDREGEIVPFGSWVFDALVYDAALA